MSLADREPATAAREAKCHACRIFTAHPEDEATVNAWRLAGHEWQPMADAVNAEHGTDLSWHSLSRHVRGKCLGSRGTR